MPTIDSRHFASYREVHFWPGTGRVLMIDKPPTRRLPLLIDLYVAGRAGSMRLQDNTTLTARTLAKGGELVIHHRDGTVGRLEGHFAATTSAPTVSPSHRAETKQTPDQTILFLNGYEPQPSV